MSAEAHDPEFWEALAAHTWDWSWIGGVWAPSLRIRVSDADGWIEHGGYVLLLEGKVTRSLADARPPAARIRSVQDSPNITHVTLHCPPDQWDAVQHQPTGHIGINLLPGPWPAPAWRPAVNPGWMRGGMSTFRDLCAQWSAWVHYAAPQFPQRGTA